jgi:phenylacetate-CoA ligase
MQKDLLKKINHIVDYGRNYSPYYKKLFRRINLPKKISAFSQFGAVPVTFRSELVENNDEFIAVPKNMWVDVAATTGTMGKPIYIPFTQKDVINNSDFIADKFLIFGLRKEDVAYITSPIEQSMWIGGLSVWLGCFRTGACSLRAGNIAIEKHIELIRKFSPTVIFGVPSFILRLGEEIRNSSLKNSFKPRLVVTFGENIMNRDFSRNALGRNIEKIWRSKAISLYGSTEASPGVECAFQAGHHILPEMVYVEIVDPKTHRTLGPKEEGLVVMTHFGRDGLPLIRYANGDISFLDTAKCKCGRITPRLGPVLGRIDEMVKIRGVNIYPSQLESFLQGLDFIHDFVVELFTDDNLCDGIRVFIMFKNEYRKKGRIKQLDYVQSKLKAKFGVKIDVIGFENRGKKEESGFKQHRIADKRISVDNNIIVT